MSKRSSTIKARDRGEWLSRLRAAPAETLAAAYMHYQYRLSRVASARLDRRLASRIDVSDVLQDSYVEALQRLDSYLASPTMPLYDWLRFLVVQRVIAIHRRHLRAQKRDIRRDRRIKMERDRDSSHGSLDERLCGPEPTPTTLAIRDESLRLIQQLLDQLARDDQEILILRHVRELTNQQAARQLGISAAAASKRYCRALRRFSRAATGLGSLAANDLD